MSLKVKLDENLGRSHAELFRQRGHDVDRVTDEGLSGEADDDVWLAVQREGRFFVTLDLDFSDVRQFPPGSHAGVLLIRAGSKDRDAVSRVIERVLNELDLGSLAGCLAVADEHRTRIRRPPLQQPSPNSP